MITEVEALEKWCPFARTPSRVDVGYDPPQLETVVANRGTPDGLLMEALYLAPCLGSECMAWRWSNGPVTDGSGTGYCGLASKP